MERLWMGLLILVPLLPKVAVANLAGTPILLDDFALFLGVFLALVRLLFRSFVTGDFRLTLFCIAPLLGSLVLYKAIDLSILGLFLPWTDRWGIGKGVLVNEGVLVLGKWLIFFFLYVLFYTSLRNREIIRSIVNLYILSIAVVVVVGLAQFFVLGHRALTSTFRNIHVLTEQAQALGVKDPWLDATGVGHEHLGGFAILSASILGGMLLCRWPKRVRQRYLIGLLWMGCVFCLIFSSSRGAWVGGLCAMAMFSWFSLKKRQLGKLLFLSLLVVGSLVLLNWAQDIDVVGFAEGRTAELFGMLSGEVRDDSAKNRILLFSALWEAFLSSPVVGWGPGGAGRIAEGQFSRELVEGGLIGSGLFIYLLIKTGRIALRSYHLSSDPLVQGVSIGFACGLTGLLGQAMFTELFIVTKIGTPFWILAAIAHKLYSLERQQPEIA